MSEKVLMKGNEAIAEAAIRSAVEAEDYTFVRLEA